MAHDVFISHASQDKPTADAVCALLEAHGIRCWTAPRDIPPGSDWGSAILDGIHASRVMILIFSASVNQSDHVKREVERAIAHNVIVIPLRIEDVRPAGSLEYFLSSVHWLDAISPPLESHVTELASTVQRILNMPLPDVIPGPKTGIPADPNKPATAQPIPNQAPPSAPQNNLQRNPPSPKPSWLVPALLAGGVFLVIFLLFQFTDIASRLFHLGGSGAAGVIPGISKDPIVGCWDWSTKLQYVFGSDGKVHAGPIEGKWRGAGDKTSYSVTWPPLIDTLVLSRNSAILTGHNNYGFALSGRRIEDHQPHYNVNGRWKWFNGVEVDFSPDFSVKTGDLRGRWKLDNPATNTYQITWPDPVDTLAVAPDHQSLSGVNQYGFQASATRSTGLCSE